jgi:hypothetical protein
MELGNELRAGFVSLQKFHNVFCQHLPSLDHIKLNAVDVVSHLGDIIPIPTLFCSMWKVLFITSCIGQLIHAATWDFNYIVQIHCKNRIGTHFIKQGDYKVICSEDSQIVGLSELASMVEQGMKLEMSIVLWQQTNFQDIKEKCPRCHHINVNATVDQAWIQWKVPFKFYIC